MKRTVRAVVEDVGRRWRRLGALFASCYLGNYESASASAAGTSSDTDWGIFRVTLGAPMTVAGVNGFAVTTSGKPIVGQNDFTPKYTFIGISGQRWVGSTDGATLVTLYDPSLTSGSNGFFLNLGASQPVKVQSGTFDGQYNQLAGVTLSNSISSGGCEFVLSQQVCTDDVTSFSRVDYLKDGLGPVGFKSHVGYSFGGTFPQIVNSDLLVELIGTSLQARDGSAVTPAPWSLGPDMPKAQFAPNAASVGTKIIVYQGTDVQTLDTVAGTWSSSTSPYYISDAVSVGTRVAVFNGKQGYLHDPVAGTFTPMAATPSSGSTVEGAVPWTHADGTTDVVLLISRGTAYVNLDIWRYQTASNSWNQLGSIDRGGNARFKEAAAGDKVYLFGGYSSGSYGSNVSVIDLTTLAYKELSFWNSSVKLSVGGISHVGALLNGKIYVLGGYNSSGQLRNVDVIDPATDTVSAGPTLYDARQDAAAAVVGDKLYLMGGNVSGEFLKSVEILKP